MNIHPTISLICPCYNEEAVVTLFLQTLIPILIDTAQSFEIIFINDGSTDATLLTLLQAKENYQNIKILNFSRNFGKEAALSAGLQHAQGEVVIPIDVDLQDPPKLITLFLQKWEEGYDVVVAKRVDRSSDNFFKRISSSLFYKVYNKVADISIPSNVGDYRLMSRKVVNSINALPENQRFMKGLFTWVGYKTAIIEYKRVPRIAGKSNFTSWKLWNFALDGITSFSTTPLKLSLYTGILIAFFAFIYGSVIITRTLIYGIDMPGYASLLSTILFLGGIQLISIGILGEYIGRTYSESKQRPAYIIDTIH